MNFETPSLAVLCESAMCIDAAKELAGDLDAPLFLGAPLGDFPFLLAVTTERVELRMTKAGAPGPLAVDFASGALDYRRRKGGSQMILKAVGGVGQNVFDATAGLGRDAFILASLGCQVTAREKSPVLAALVRDGLKRAAPNPAMDFLRQRLDFDHGDSRAFLSQTTRTWDVIFLDPMFPKQERDALPKKELQILQEFLGVPGDENEAQEILGLAFKRARRVVVKRHLRSPELRKNPSVCYKGASTRFDVYLVT